MLTKKDFEKLKKEEDRAREDARDKIRTAVREIVDQNPDKYIPIPSEVIPAVQRYLARHGIQTTLWEINNTICLMMPKDITLNLLNSEIYIAKNN